MGEIFEVLSNERRRLVLEYLDQHDDRGTDLRELVNYVAAAENDTTEANLDSDERKRVYTALRQSHLPKMNDIGVIEYDKLRGEVALNEAAREVQMYLQYFPTNSFKWSYYYLGLTIVSSLVFVFYLVGVFPFGHLSELLLALLILVLFGLGSIAHTCYTILEERSNPLPV